MNYHKIAQDILVSYPISNPEIQYIRHNENMTFKVIDTMNDHTYLLRVHNPVSEGLFGPQHTLEGIQSEIIILQELHHKNLIRTQVPITNQFGDYITKYELDNFNQPCYATILEWIDGLSLTLKEDNIADMVYLLGQNLALFHTSLEDMKPSKDFIRPIYDIARVDSTIIELQYCVEVELFTEEQYEIIKEVMTLIKKQMNDLSLRGNEYGIIHADMQLGNIVVNNDNPCIIDLGFCGFGYYAFDLGSAISILPSNLRKTFLDGYASKRLFSYEDTKYIEGQIFMDVFISYILFMRDNQNNGWIKDHTQISCDTFCKDFLNGKEVLYKF